MNRKILPATLLILSSMIVRSGYAQLAFDNKELSVPQQCAMRLSEESVAKKLKLNPAQQKAYILAVKTYVAETKALEKSKTAKESDHVTSDRKFANACLGTLTPAQKQQLLQLCIPEIGSIALLDPAISSRVGLTPAQIKQIEGLCRGIAKRDEDVSAMIASAIESVPVPKAGSDTTKYNAKCAQIVEMYNGERQRISREKKDTDRKVFAVMNASQQAKWVEIGGVVPGK